MSSSSKDIDKDRPTRAFCAILSGEVGEGWGSDRLSTSRISVFAQRNLYLGKTPTSKEHPLKFLQTYQDLRLSHLIHIMDGYRVCSDQVVVSGVSGTMQDLCLRRTLRRGDWKMCGISFGIQNISGKCRYVMSGQTDE